MTSTPPESQSQQQAPQEQPSPSQAQPQAGKQTFFAKIEAKSYILIAIVIAIVLLSRLSATMFMILHDGEKQDYDRWYRAGQRVLQGKDLTYNLSPGQKDFDFQEYDELKFFRLPPAFAVYVSPLANLPFWAYAVCWFVLSAGAAVISVLLAMKMLHGRYLPKNPIAMLLPIVGIVAFAWADLHCGNTNLIQLALLMLGAYAVWRRDGIGGDVTGGLATGLSVAIKAYPAAILPSLLASFRWRLMIFVVLGAAIWTLVVPGFVRGFERNYNETIAWYGRIVAPYLGIAPAGRAEEWGSRSYSHKNQSLYPLVKRLTMHVDVTDRHKSELDKPPIYVNVVEWSSKTATAVFAALILVILAAIFYVCRNRKPAPNRINIVLDMAIGMNFMLIVSPIAWYYFFSLLLLPMAVGAWRLVVTESRQERTAMIVVWALSFAFFLAASISFWARVYGATVMLAVLWFVVMLYYRNKCHTWQTAS